jgi:hypothetical protein
MRALTKDSKEKKGVNVVKHPKQDEKENAHEVRIDHLLNFYVLLEVYYRKTTKGDDI